MLAGLVLTCIFLLQPASGARILGLFPYKGASHFYVFQPLMEELARRGHSVDVVSHLPRTQPLPNYTDISVVDKDSPTQGFADFETFEKMESGFLTNILGLLYLGEGYERVLSRPEVLALTNVSYDLVITEMFNSDLFFGLTYKIGAPVIGFSSCQILSWTADIMAAPPDLSYVPGVIGGHGPNMDFFERLKNIVEVWFARAFYRFVIHHDAQALAEKYLGPLPNLADIASNTSLLFVNSHFSLLGQHPLPQSVIEVGGINVRDPKPLPEDLESVFNNSKGVIYFSMGSVLKGSSLPADKQAMFINAFESTGRTVLWKREESLPTKHDNIITRPWFPQRDILGHPKTELFIAHCGLLGVNEAVISGVPLICIPMFGDQFHNARFVEDAGIGLKLHYQALTESKIRFALSELLNNEVYKKRAAEVSAAYLDRPMPALETAVFWVEYLLRHGSRPLAAPFRQLSHWQRLGYDVISTILLIGIIITYIFVIAIRKMCFSSKNIIKEKQS